MLDEQVSRRGESREGTGADVRVLVVEDFEPMARAIVTGLRREGMAVDAAYDGGAALDQLAVTRYDVVVLDRDLPGVHGDEICRRLAAAWNGGTALAPIRVARAQGADLFVWVDETRPLLQGARLTAWELARERIPHAVIVDNAAGAFMRTGQVDAVIVGADRIARNGDFANKIGTYKKAVVARENGIPFYVAAPWSTFNARRPDGRAIPVEERAEEEVLELAGRRIAPQKSHARNPAFDVTPAKYVTAFVTPRGVVRPREPHESSRGAPLRE